MCVYKRLRKRLRDAAEPREGTPMSTALALISTILLYLALPTTLALAGLSRWT